MKTITIYKRYKHHVSSPVSDILCKIDSALKSIGLMRGFRLSDLSVVEIVGMLSKQFYDDSLLT